MAWDKLPTTKAGCGRIARSCGMDNAARAEAMTLFDVLAQKYPDEEQPLAFSANESAGKKKCLVKRIFTSPKTKGGYGLSEEDIKKFAGLTKLKIKMGNGSRGGRGTGNQGNKFEVVMANAINKWFEEGDDKLTGQGAIRSMLRQIVLVQDDYGWFNNRKLKARVMGGIDTKRPLKLKNGTWFVGGAGGGQGYDIGEKVSDVTVEGDRTGPVYLSLKTSGTTALVNLGIRTNYFPIADIKAGNIKKADGQKLLNTFGLDEAKFCQVFNDFEKGTPYSNTSTPGNNFDHDMLTALIKGSLGYGFHYVHRDKGKIWHMKMTKEFLEQSCIPNKSGITIEYGGTSGDGAKRVNIVMDTPTLHLQFNIRNTSSSGTKADLKRIYPTHLQAGYRFKGETKMTHFWEAKDDTFSGVSSAALKMIN